MKSFFSIGRRWRNTLRYKLPETYRCGLEIFDKTNVQAVYFESVASLVFPVGEVQRLALQYTSQNTRKH